VLKKLAAAGAIVAAVGSVVLGAAPAYAGGGPDMNHVGNNNGASNFQVLPVQVCPGAVLPIAVLGKNSSGACVNGPATAQHN